MVSKLALALTGVLVGCAATPANEVAAPTAPANVDAPAPVGAQARPAATPLPEVKLELKLDAEPSTVKLPHIPELAWDETLIADALSPPLQARFRSAVGAASKLLQQGEPVRDAYFESASCEDEGCAAREARHQALRRPYERSRTQIVSAHAATVAAFEGELEKAPTAELALALARLHGLEQQMSEADSMFGPAKLGNRYGEFGETDQGSGAVAKTVEPLLERGKALSSASTDLGRHARYVLMLHRWRSGHNQRTREQLDELLPVAPEAQRFELQVRRGLLLGAAAEDAAAMDAFARALATPVRAGEELLRAAVTAAQTLAAYRAGRFAEALSLALAEFDHGRSPKRVSFEYGTNRATLLRLAADSVERLGSDPNTLSASAGTKSALLSELAVRAWHRHDPEQATRLAEGAVTLSSRDAADAFAVLIAAATRAEDEDRLKSLRDTQKQARPTVPLIMPSVYALMGAKKPPPEYEARSALGEDSEPSSSRNVFSLLRLCLESSASSAPGRVLVVLKATVKDDKSAQVVVGDETPKPLATCLRDMGPKVLAHAPSSIAARVELSHPWLSVWRQSGVLGALSRTAGEEPFVWGQSGLSEPSGPKPKKPTKPSP